MFDDFPKQKIELGDSRYPNALALIPNPPKVLYIRGNLSGFNNCLGIVGSRRISSYGTAVLEHLFAGISTELKVVSGFMRGVDMTSHQLSVEHSVPTFAILPCGIEVLHPSYQMNLYRDILNKGGLVISEYGKNEPSKDWMFVKRNRIIAGLCSHLLVVEATKDSGSLITYEYARKYGKTILTVPGDIFRENQQGICQILKENAKPVFSGSDINEFFGLTRRAVSFANRLAFEEQKIYDSLPADMNSLSRKTGISISNLSTFVSNLQINGVIKEVKGVLYAVKG